jgi:DeoR/GlpR family transcriptional regulator of sugar metabolism
VCLIERMRALTWELLVDYGPAAGEMTGCDQNASTDALVPAQRRELIAAHLRDTGSVAVSELESEFGISPMTARRDLQALEREGRARRTHGGAVSPRLATQEDSFESRLTQSQSSKESLGRAARALVKDGEAVFIDSSTTAYYAVRSLLAAGMRVTVLTNSVPVMELVVRAELPKASLIGLAGSLRKPSRSFVGPATVAAVERHFADKALFSVNGVAPGGVLTEADPLEAEVKRRMLVRSKSSVLMLDGSKFERVGLSAIAGVKTIAKVLVADATPGQVDRLAASGVDLEEVG